MSKDFDWQTEENSDWDAGLFEEGLASPQGGFFSRFGRWPLWLGLTAVFLIIVGLLVYALANGRVAQVENSIVDDVLAAHVLARRAEREKDFDLLAALIAGDGSNWEQMQLELLNIDLLLDRRPLGLTMLPESGSTPPQVMVLPDLLTAEVVERIPYHAGPLQAVGDSLQAEMILLEHTFYYERRGDSWLLTSLPDDETFWGDEQRYEEEYLTLVYSRREEAFVVGYLAGKLNDLIGQICADSEVDCLPGFEVVLQLTHDPTGLWTLNFDDFVLSVDPTLIQTHLSMPSPTLIGRPVDDAAFEALYQGYANWVGRAMVHSFTFDRLEGQALAEKLAVWGLEPPPAPPLALPIPQTVAAPPIPFPEQDVLLACPDSESLRIVRYNPRDNRWSNEFEGDEALAQLSPIEQYGGSFMVSLPDDSGVLVRVRQLLSRQNPFKLFLWRDGQEQLLVESSGIPVLLDEFIQRQYDASGRYFVLYNVAQGQESLPYAIDLDACSTGACKFQEYNGFPYWSPDLSRALLFRFDDETRLTLRDEQSGEEMPIGNGFAPIWADNENFSYLRFVEGATPDAVGGGTFQILTANVRDLLDATVLVDSADLAAVLPDGEVVAGVSIQSVVAHPDYPNWLFLMVNISAESGFQVNYILSLRRDTGELDVIFDSNGDIIMTGALYITPDGRYLSLPIVSGPSTSSIFMQYLTLIPLDTTDMSVGESFDIQENIMGNSYDWSQDGRWLLIYDQGFIHLIAPGYDYNQKIPYTIETCQEALWVNALTDDE